jgi:hypothetical protein
MPWDEATRMSQRLRFIYEFDRCQYTSVGETRPSTTHDFKLVKSAGYSVP